MANKLIVIAFLGTTLAVIVLLFIIATNTEGRERPSEPIESSEGIEQRIS
jgi:hypothetical protein